MHTFLRLPMDEYYISRGWEAFLGVGMALRAMDLSVDDLEYCYTEENYGRMVAVFEVSGRA